MAAAVQLGERDLLRVGCLLLALPLVSLAVVSRTRYLLNCTRTVEPARVQAGRSAAVVLRLDNVSRLSTGVLLVEDALPYSLGTRPRFVLDKVEPRGVREVDYTVRSDVRGRYRVGPLTVRLADPFGLCELTRSFDDVDHLVVTPVVTTLPAVRLGGDWTGGGEASSRAVSSSGEDDAATREYRQGDDLRKVHWRSTARTGELMVRREEQPWQTRASLLLDTRLRAHRGDGPGSSFEWAVSAAASIGLHLARGGFRLRLLEDTGADVVSLSASTAETLLLDRLAVVTASTGRSLAPALTLLRRTGGEGLLVAVLGSLDADEVQQLARLRHGSTACVAVLLDTAGWVAATPRARAAADNAFDAAATLLLRSGWRVLPVRHGTTLSTLWSQAGARSGPVAAGVAGGHAVRSDAAPAPSVVAVTGAR